MADSPAPPQPNTATTAAVGLITSTKNQITHIYPQSRDYLLTKAQASVRSLQGGRAEALWNHAGSGKQYVERLWGRSVHGLSEVSGLEEETVKFLVTAAFVGCTGVSLWPIEVGKMMIAPGSGRGVKILRSAFEKDPKGYFKNLRAKRYLVEKAGMSSYTGYLVLGCVGLAAYVGSVAGERLYTETGTDFPDLQKKTEVKKKEA